ncbi:MAG: TonB-dependent receptor family protein [Bacteroidota bacterium]
MLAVEGIVIDETSKQPIEYATISVFRNDSLLDGTTTKKDGSFKLKIKADFDYLEVSFIGYQTTQIPRKKIVAKEKIVVSLFPHEAILEEVTIQAERTVTQQLIDRKIINVGADLQQTGSTALEIFDQITEIQTDLSSGVIFLRGSSNVLVLINGKPSGLSPSELLAQMPATSISKIELITSPSAKYQADGISGIINVILKKNFSKGLNLNLNAGIGTKRNNLSTDGNYNYQNFNFRWNISRSERDMDSKQWLKRSYNTGSIEEIYAPHDYGGKVEKVSLGTDFLFSEKGELSVSWDYVDDYHNFYNKVFYTYLTGEPSVDYLRTSEHTHLTNTWNANYRHKLNQEGHFLELDYNLNKNDNDLPAADFEEDVFLFEELYSNINTLHRLSLDHTLPISDDMRLESGATWNKRILESQYQFDDDNNLNEQLGLFDYQEEVLGLYSQLNWTFDQLTLQGGIRYEHFNSLGSGQNNTNQVNYTFANFFPSFHLNYNLSETQKLNIGLSKRISRPHFNHINPYRIGNPYFRFVGNAQLLPEYSYNTELTHLFQTEKINVSTTAFYRHRTDIIQRLESFTSEGVQEVFNINAGIKNSYGIETTIAKQLFPLWRTNLTGNYYFTKINQTEIVTWDRLYSSSVQLKNTFTIGEIWTTDLTYRHTPKFQNAFYYVEPRNRIDFALRGRFFKNRLSVNLRVQDVLNKNLFYRNTYTNTLVQEEKWRFQSQTRGYLLNLNYQIIKNSNFTRNRKQRNYFHGGTVD